MTKFLVDVFRVSGQISLRVEAGSPEEAQERALVASKAAEFGEPEARRLAVVDRQFSGAQLSPHADAERAVTGLAIHVVPSRQVDAAGRVKA